MSSGRGYRPAGRAANAPPSHSPIHSGHQNHAFESQTHNPSDPFDISVNDEPNTQEEEDDSPQQYAHHALSSEDAQQLQDDEESHQEYYAEREQQLMRTPQTQKQSQSFHPTQSPLQSAPHTPYHNEDDDVSGIKTVPSTPPMSPSTAAAAGGAQPKKKLLDAGLAAMKKNLIPGLILQAIAATILIIYYSSASAQDAFNSLAQFKADAGYAFSAISTMIFGGFIPWCVGFAKKEYERRKKVKLAEMTVDLHMDIAAVDHDQTSQLELGSVPAHGIMLSGSEIPIENLSLESNTQTSTVAVSEGRSPLSKEEQEKYPAGKPSPLAECIFFSGFWFLKGAEVDAFYRLQGLIFGNGTDAWTIIAKVFVDQFIYNPPWAAPSVLGAYLWKDCNFDFKLWWSKFWTRHFWFWTIPECLISLWLVWCPACSMIYCLPGALQVPLFNIVLCFWCLILAMLADGGK